MSSWELEADAAAVFFIQFNQIPAVLQGAIYPEAVSSALRAHTCVAVGWAAYRTKLTLGGNRRLALPNWQAIAQSLPKPF